MDSFKELGFNVTSWLMQVEEQYKNKVKNRHQNELPIKLLKKEARAVIWSMSELFEVERNGVPGLACHLLECYLATKLYGYEFEITDVQTWNAYRQTQVPRIILWMASCIQLAGKMSSSMVNLLPIKILEKLAAWGIYYKVEDIKASEQEIFKKLGFHVPLWTSVEIAEVLANEIKVSIIVLKTVHTVVDMAELRRNYLNSNVQWVADLSNSTTSSSMDDSRIRTTHLAAAGVIAAERYNSINNPDTISRLAKIVRAPVSYLKCLSDLVLSVYLDDLNTPSPFHK